MAALSDMRQANDAIEAQMQEWKQQRFANGEDPMDWVSFRQHVQQLGAPDPGEAPPDEFYRWDDGLHGGQPQAQGAEASTASAEAQPHAFGKAVSEVNNLRADPNAEGDTATWPDSAGSGSKTSKWPEIETKDR